MRPDPPPRELVPDPIMRREFNVSAMTVWRWDRSPSLGFPKAIVIRQRKYRLRHELEAFKANLAERTATGEATTSAPLDPRRRRTAKAVGGLATG
jgi:hypothetical protein